MRRISIGVYYIRLYYIGLSWSLPIFDPLPIRTPFNSPNLTPISRALAQTLERPNARSFFSSGEKRPFHFQKCVSPFIHRGEMHFDGQKMGKLQGDLGRAAKVPRSSRGARTLALRASLDFLKWLAARSVNEPCQR